MKFYTKPMLRLYRYFALMIFVGLPLFLALLACDRSLVKQSDIIIHISVCISLSVLGGILIHKFFWEKFFAILIVSDNKICWKCPFRKTITLSFKKCNYIGVESEEAHNGYTYPFVYISQKPFPAEYSGKINKLPCDKGFVKFWYSASLCNFLISCFPGDKTKTLSAYLKRENDSTS